MLPADGGRAGLHVHIHGLRFLRQAAQGDLHLRPPHAALTARGHVQGGDVGAAQLLHRHGPGDSPVGIIVVGHMQGGIFAEAVVRLHPQHMLAEGDVPGQAVEGGIAAVMLRKQRVVQIHLGPEAHAAENKPQRAAAGEHLFIHSPAPVALQSGVAFHGGGHGHLRGEWQSALVKGRQRPYGRGLAGLAQAVGGDTAIHEISLAYKHFSVL